MKIIMDNEDTSIDVDDSNVEEDKTSEENEEEQEEQKKESSAVAQKKKYRDRYKTAQDEIKELKAKLKPIEKIDDKEAQAEKYIKEKAIAAIKEMEAEKEAKEKAKVVEFEDRLEKVLEDNPDVDASQITDIVKELNIDPETAVKVLKRGEKKKKKPSMPSSKRGTTSEDTKFEPKDVKEKSMYQISREAIKEFKSQE